MKTIYLLMILVAATTATAYAQNVMPARTTFGIRAGINFQNLNGQDNNGDRLENNLKVGYHVGVNVEMPLATDFYLQPGLLLSTKGGNTVDGAGNNNGEVSLTYLELPVNFLYKPMLRNGHLILGFGPYLGYAVGGSVEYGDDNNEVKQDIKFASSINANQAGEPYFRRLDAGANLIFGYGIGRNLSAQLNAQLGLANIHPDIEGMNDRTKVKNTGFGISLGYRF